MSIDNSYNFKRVNALITTSGIVGPNRLKDLGPERYDIVINLLPEESEYAVENEQQIVEEQGIKYIYIPVDFKNPALAKYDQFVSTLDEAKERKVHIHCAANYRVSVFYALYAESRQMWNRTEAQEFIHDLWQPEEYRGWPQFIAKVRECITNG